MTNLQQSIEQEVGAFVRSINELVRRAAIEALERAVMVPAVGGIDRLDDEPRRGRRNREKEKHLQTSTRKPAAPREPAELAALTERLYEAIAAHPGERMEVLAPTLGCTAKQLRVSIEHLLAQERVKKAGQRRTMRYFPMDTDRRSPTRRTGKGRAD